MATDQDSASPDGSSFEDDLRTRRQFVANKERQPLLPQPLQLPYATELTLELPLDASEGIGATCTARAQLAERFPSRTVDVVGCREIRCGRMRDHEGDHIAILQRTLLHKRRARAASWSS